MTTPDVTTRDGAFEFVVGIVLNQSQRAEQAWAAARVLGERLGTCEPARWSELGVERIAAALRAPKALHRFPRMMAGYLAGAAEHIATSYGGDARRLWVPQLAAAELLARLVAIRGIGRHKASVAVFLLTVEHGIAVIDDHTEASVRGCAKLADQFGGLTEARLVDGAITTEL